ncbi:MAG TPA: heavy metal-binding protein, partial [Clostridium sp.]|nr:heavy metal-binding protein [Clostridium sp.]
FNSSKVKAEIDEGQTSADKLKEIVSNLGYEVLELKA